MKLLLEYLAFALCLGHLIGAAPVEEPATSSHLRTDKSMLSSSLSRRELADLNADEVSLPDLYIYLLCREDQVRDVDIRGEIEDYYRNLLSDEDESGIAISDASMATFDLEIKEDFEDCYGATQVSIEIKGTVSGAGDWTEDEIADKVTSKNLKEGFGKAICDNLSEWEARIDEEPGFWDQWKFDTDDESDYCVDWSSSEAGLAVGIVILIVLLSICFLVAVLACFCACCCC